MAGRSWAPRVLFGLAALGPVHAATTAACEARLAVGPMGSGRAVLRDGDLRFVVPGIDGEAHGDCPGSELLVLQLVLEYRVEGSYDTGRLDVRMASLPIVDAMPGAGPWYPVTRRQLRGRTTLTFVDRPTGFVPLRQEFVADGRLRSLSTRMRFATIVVARSPQTLRPLDGIEWTTELAATVQTSLAFAAQPMSWRRLRAEEIDALIARTSMEPPVARERLEWWWVPAGSGTGRRVATTRPAA